MEGLQDCRKERAEGTYAALPLLPPRSQSGRLRSHLDLDLAWLRLFAQRDADAQDAVLEFGGNLRRVHGLRKRERPAEGTIPPFGVMVLLVLDVGVELLLALDGEHEV